MVFDLSARLCKSAYRHCVFIAGCKKGVPVLEIGPVIATWTYSPYGLSQMPPCHVMFAAEQPVNYNMSFTWMQKKKSGMMVTPQKTHVWTGLNETFVWQTGLSCWRQKQTAPEPIRKKMTPQYMLWFHSVTSGFGDPQTDGGHAVSGEHYSSFQ